MGESTSTSSMAWSTSAKLQRLYGNVAFRVVFGEGMDAVLGGWGAVAGNAPLGNGLGREKVLLSVQLEEELGDELALLLLPFDGFGDSLEEQEQEQEPREQQANAPNGPRRKRRTRGQAGAAPWTPPCSGTRGP